MAVKVPYRGTEALKDLLICHAWFPESRPEDEIIDCIPALGFALRAPTEAPRVSVLSLPPVSECTMEKPSSMVWLHGAPRVPAALSTGRSDG